MYGITRRFGSSRSHSESHAVPPDSAFVRAITSAFEYAGAVGADEDVADDAIGAGGGIPRSTCLAACAAGWISARESWNCGCEEADCGRLGGAAFSVGNGFPSSPSTMTTVVCCVST